MEYMLFIVAVLLVLAIADLIVGVSNDAVNFLNSAIGSKVTTYRNIILIASAGILAGCFFSSGMMEIARKGIFQPQHFTFDKVMWIFLAVMLADIVLLDIFNTLGLDDIVPSIGWFFIRMKNSEVRFQYVSELHHAQHRSVLIFVCKQISFFCQYLGINGVLHHAAID